MDRSEAEARVREVQRIMERTTLYTLLPGLPAIVGGCLALAGCVVSLVALGSFDFQKVTELPQSAQTGLLVLWAIIGALAVAMEVFWTRHAAKKLGISPTARPARFAALSLSPSVIVAIVLTARLLIDGHIGYIVPVWMMCYGTGLYAAGLFSVRMPRMLGLAFIVAGAAGLLFLAQFGVLLAAVAFGLFHVAFGFAVMKRTQSASAS